MAAEIESDCPGVIPEEGTRVPGRGPRRLALIDLLMLSPVLPLLVGAGGRARCQPGKLVLLQWEIPVAPAEPAAVDQPVLDGWHLERGERLAEWTLVIREFSNLHRCVLGALHVSVKARGVGGLNRYV